MTPLAFATAFLFALLFINIFRKNIAYNFAIFFLALLVSVLYFRTQFYGSYFITVACLIIAGYSLWEMTHARIKK